MPPRIIAHCGSPLAGATSLSVIPPQPIPLPQPRTTLCPARCAMLFVGAGDVPLGMFGCRFGNPGTTLGPGTATSVEGSGAPGQEGGLLTGAPKTLRERRTQILLDHLANTPRERKSTTDW